MQTPFEQAVEKHRAGTLQAPAVYQGLNKIDAVGYQISVHMFYLKLMSKGIPSRQIKFNDIKHFYGLKNRTAAACVPELQAIADKYKAEFEQLKQQQQPV